MVDINVKVSTEALSSYIIEAATKSPIQGATPEIDVHTLIDWSLSAIRPTENEADDEEYSSYEMLAGFDKKGIWTTRQKCGISLGDVVKIVVDPANLTGIQSTPGSGPIGNPIKKAVNDFKSMYVDTIRHPDEAIKKQSENFVRTEVSHFIPSPLPPEPYSPLPDYGRMKATEFLKKVNALAKFLPLGEIKIVIHYRAQLSKIESLTLKGNQLNSRLVFIWKLSAELIQPVPIPGEPIKPVKLPEVLEGEGESVINVSASLATSDEAKLAFKDLKSEFASGGEFPQFKKISLHGVSFKVDPNRFLNADQLLAASRKAFVGISEILAEELAGEKLGNKLSDKLTFGKRIRDVITKEGRPISVDKGRFYLDIAPTELDFGQPSGIFDGNTNYLLIPAELQTPLRIVVASNVPAPFWTSGTSEFSANEITNITNIVFSLTNHSNTLSAFLWTNALLPSDQKLLKSYNPTNSSSNEVVALLLQALNNTIDGPAIYESNRFQTISLRPETSQLNKRQPIGSDLAHLNRLLLEDAYPAAFSRKRITTPDDLRIRVITNPRHATELQIAGDVELRELTEIIDTNVLTFWKKKKYKLLSGIFEPLPSKLYESKEHRLVVMLPIRFRGASNEVAKLYAWGVPKILEGKDKGVNKMTAFKIDEFDWTPDTKNVLLRSLGWLAHDELRNSLRDTLEDTGNKKIAKLETDIENFSGVKTFRTDKGNILMGLNLGDHHVEEISIRESFLRVVLIATGEPYFTIN